MWTASLCERISGISPLILRSLVDWGLKGFAILSMAWVVTLSMKRASAAVRHLIWLVGTFSLLIFPLLSIALPEWHILPSWHLQPQVMAMPAPTVATTPEFSTAPSGPQLLPNYSPPRPTRVIPTRLQQPITIADAPAKPPLGLNWQAWIVLTWVAVSLIYFVYVALAYASLRWIGQRCTLINSRSWSDLLSEARRSMIFGGPVELLSSSRRSMPMTWGLRRTRILVPSDSSHWTIQQQRTVLLHELAHARRLDCMTQLLTHVTCGVYWFDPLVWVAARKMQIEREQACDDLVLATGAKASTYAEQLLQIASDLSPLRFSLLPLRWPGPTHWKADCSQFWISNRIAGQLPKAQ